MISKRTSVAGGLGVAALVLIGLFAGDAYNRYRNGMLLDCGVPCGRADSPGTAPPGEGSSR